MATYGNTNNSNTREYRTDEAGMIEDAKQYAKKDFHMIEKCYAKVHGEPMDKETKIAHVKGLIAVKYDAIVAKRLNRDDTFDTVEFSPETQA